ncbi:glycosyltransferase family 4 protein [Bacillus sp. FJAT-51639]|uniref:Glycosyltransferase family 4 protein n=2 Tax=Bacillus TaxID=1386 RepID=A0ABU8FC75_9BACI
MKGSFTLFFYMKRKEGCMEPLRILMLAWEYPPMMVGGLGRHVYELSRALAYYGHDVHVVTVHEEQCTTYEKVHGVHVHRVSVDYREKYHFYEWIAALNKSMLAYTQELCKGYVFDVIHAHDWLVAICAMDLQKKQQLTLVTTVHATEHGRNSGIYTSLQWKIHMHEKELVKESNVVIVCSQFMKSEVMRNFEINSEGVIVHPNGIDCNFFHAVTPSLEITKRYHLSDRLVVFSIGRIVNEKGFYTIIEAAPHITQRYPQVLFIIAGQGTMLEQYRAVVQRKGLQHSILFLGHITEEEQRAFFQRCDVLLIPSLYEPFGIVVLEGMLAKKPVLVSRVGGLQEIIIEGVNGFLMKAGCAQSLNEKLICIIEQPEIAQCAANKGYEDVLVHYNWSEIARATAHTYEKAVQHHKCGG